MGHSQPNCAVRAMSGLRPISDRAADIHLRQLRAGNGLMHRRKVSFDHLVGRDNERRGNDKAEGFGGLEIDDQSIFVPCTTGRSEGLAPFSNWPT